MYAPQATNTSHISEEIVFASIAKGRTDIRSCDRDSNLHALGADDNRLCDTHRRLAQTRAFCRRQTYTRTRVYTRESQWNSLLIRSDISVPSGDGDNATQPLTDLNNGGPYRLPVFPLPIATCVRCILDNMIVFVA